MLVRPIVKGSGKLLGMVAVCLALAAGLYAQERPNILIIVTDDQGYGEMSAHGHPFLKTPNMDRLHDDGVRLADYHVTPMCTPTRGALFSGMDPLHNRASFIAGQRMAMDTEIPTMADYFRQAGYRTGLFGKWHLGDVYPHRPIDRGFDEEVTFAGAHVGSLGDYWNNDYFDDHYRVNGEPQAFKGYVQDVLTDETIAFMERCQQQKEPFLAVMATPLPHLPYYAPADSRAIFEARPDLNVDQEGHFAMLTEIDKSLGQLLDFLDASGLAEDTIVVFMSDNGGTIGVPIYNAGLRGHKTTYYEGGHRSPGFIRWPAGGLSGGREVEGLSYVTDILPTLLDLCGVPFEDGNFDGISLADNLRTGDPIDPERMVVIQYGAFTTSPMGKEKKDERVVMYKDWRLLNSWYPGDTDDSQELYDLSEDRAQSHNVIAAHPDVAAKMQAFYDQWWDGIEPNFDKWVRYNVGDDSVPVVEMSLQEAANTNHAWQTDVRKGIRDATGRWKLNVGQPGDYRVRLRRYPEEADLPINASAPAMTAHDHQEGSRNADDFPAGRGLMAERVRFTASNGKTYLAEVPKGAKYVDVAMKDIPAGELDIFNAVFLNPMGQVASAVFYLDIERLPSSSTPD